MRVETLESMWRALIPPLIHPLAPGHCLSALSTSPFCSDHLQCVGGPWAILDTPALHLLHAHAWWLWFHEWPFPRLHNPYLGCTPGQRNFTTKLSHETLKCSPC